jgi:hypothetical protein
MYRYTQWDILRRGDVAILSSQSLRADFFCPHNMADPSESKQIDIKKRYAISIFSFLYA